MQIFVSLDWANREISNIRFINKFCLVIYTGKNNRFPFLDILKYLKNTHKNPKFERVRQVSTRELGYANPRRSRGFPLSRILPTPRVFISGYANTGKKFSILFL